MVFVSSESAVETESRLRHVMQRTSIEHLEGCWSLLALDGEVPPDALASVKGVNSWSGLVPVASVEGERFGLTLVAFEAHLDNSGFVGWMASAIKTHTGAGVFVICGTDQARGDTFDYWAYPVDVAGSVRVLMAELRRPPEPAKLSLDVRVFDVRETSSGSAVSCDTVFEFRELEGTVEASYSGGGVIKGLLIGRRQGDKVLAACAQLTEDGQMQTGSSEIHIEPEGCGELTLTESFTWPDGRRDRNVLYAR
jgi:hypothetical protein